jgi:hypothetical protein
MSRAKPIPPGNRRIVLDRADGACEGCGRWFSALQIHHRRYRSRGGGHEVSNLLALCGMGNVQNGGCHGVAHSAEGGELGWSCNSWENPKHRPVLYRGALMWLVDDGRVVNVKPEPDF